MRGVKKNTKKIIASLFVSVLVFQGFFGFVQLVRAQGIDRQTESGNIINHQIQANTNTASSTTPTTTSGEVQTSTCDWYDVGCYMKQVFIWLLLQIRNFIYLVIASPAAAAFVWAVNPENVSGPQGVLNLPAVYELWQFIRDFFNLFFILILLFSAFATIFQVDSFNIRNIFKNVLLVALLINFSFPITRFLIDAANVPMYYFINDVIGNGTGEGGMIAMNNMLASSGISAGTMQTTGENDNVVPVLMSIVFAFLFGISLAVLSVLMIIRLVALTILLIFSPIGFAGALLPGFSQYGQEWWSKFWNYALFGPAAALMLVVALKFLQASESLFHSMQMVGTDITPGTGEATVVSQAIFFTIPIILIWTSIGMANKFSIAGAAAVVGMGMWAPRKIQEYSKKAMVNTAKFTGRKTIDATKAAAKKVPILRSVPGAYAGVKEAVKGDGKLFGKQVIPKFVTGDAAKARQELFEARNAQAKGWVQGGSRGAADALSALEDQRVKAEIDEMKKKKVNQSAAVDQMRTGKTKQSRQAAAMYLAQNDDIRNATEFNDGLAAVAGNTEFTSEFVKKSQGAIDNVTDLATALNALGTDSKTAASVIDKINPSALAATDAEYTSLLASSPIAASPVMQKQLQGKMKKEGRMNAVIDHEIRTTGASGAAATAVVDRHLDSMTVEEIAKQDGLLRTNPDAHGYVLGLRTSDPAKYQEIKNKMKSGTSALFP